MNLYKYLLLSVFIILIFKTPLTSQKLSILRDSISIDVKGKVISGNRFTLTHAVRLNHDYYCIFKEQSLNSYRKESKHLLKISSASRNVEWLNLPDEFLDAIYFDFFVKHERIYLLDYHSKNCYVYNTASNKWNLETNCDDIIYEDQEFTIAYQDHGEWGEFTYFLDKETNLEYVIEEDGKQVNKIDNRYYLTSDGQIIEIKDPRVLEKCSRNCYFTQGDSIITENVYGISYIYYDSLSPIDIQFGAKRPLNIESSWVWDDELLQIYSDGSWLNAGYVRGEGIILLANLLPNVFIQKPRHSYRGDSEYDGSRFEFYREDENNYGFMELDEDHISILGISHNQDSLQHFNKSVFELYWDYIIKIDLALSAKDVHAFEMNSGGVKLREDRIGQPGGLHPKKLVTSTSYFETYIKVENSMIYQSVQYHYDKMNGQLRSLFFEWNEPNSYATEYGFNHLFKSKEKEIAIFQNKYNYLFDFISISTGIEPIIDLGSSYLKKVTWNFDDSHGIELTCPKEISRNLEIRLVVF